MDVKKLYEHMCEGLELKLHYESKENNFIVHQKSQGRPIFAHYEGHFSGKDSVEFLTFHKENKVLLKKRNVEGNVEYELIQAKLGLDLKYKENGYNLEKNLIDQIKKLI